ncbi:MAG: prolipoprotein diacylglyceryl transferase [Coriobacteriales bacterium]|jgi:phosphatidylglycerol:prolipoprotein diacylglycerol transferase|nr:prolipoprotein diacylglyceryl transferase [Coriobacteriales bacterium]
MLPYVHIFGITIGLYGVMAVVGIFAACICAYFLCKKADIDVADEILFAVAVLIGGAVGSVILYGIVNIPYIVQTLSDASAYPSTVAFLGAIAQGFEGFVYYGGLLGAIVGVVVYARLSHTSTATWLDIFAVCMPLFHAFGRIGCFLGGCCYGMPSPFGFTMTNDPITIANGVQRFPVQLLESAAEFVIFLVILYMYKKGICKKRLIFVYFILYGIVRFSDEFLRGDYYRGFLGPLSTSQWISIVLIAVAIFAFVRQRVKRQSSVL